jgi:signal transduction histidine kinase
MRLSRPPSSPRSGLRPPRRTARLRLTVLYGGVCLVFGAILLAVTSLLTWGTVIPADTILATPQPVAASGRAPAGPARPENQEQPPTGADQIAVDRRLLLLRSGIALVIVSATAVGAGWLLAGRVLRPLSTITGAARRISASSLHERLALEGPDDELKELGDTLDGLLARLEASFDAQRRFAASASHELRTPLTRERALLEVTRADPAATASTWQEVSLDLLAFNAETERLIDALLTLASSEAGLSQREPADLAAITSAALAAPRPAIGRLGLDVHASIRPAVLDGDPLLIQQLVTNLIENAVRHNIPAGKVQVATGTSDGHAVLSVANSGQVIPPAEVSRLFQPFQRLGPRPARRDGGHGLGLSIVRAIATAHGAAIAAHALPGGGLAVDVTFPPPPGPRTAALHPTPDPREPCRPKHCPIAIAIAIAIAVAIAATAAFRRDAGQSSPVVKQATNGSAPANETDDGSSERALRPRDRTELAHRDRPGHRRARRRTAVPRRRRAAAGPARRRPDGPPGHPPRRDRQARRPPHASARVHHRRPRCRGAAPRRAGGRLAR